MITLNHLEVYEIGGEAFYAGVDLDDSPEELNDEERDAWRSGWLKEKHIFDVCDLNKTYRSWL